MSLGDLQRLCHMPFGGRRGPEFPGYSKAQLSLWTCLPPLLLAWAFLQSTLYNIVSQSLWMRDFHKQPESAFDNSNLGSECRQRAPWKAAVNNCQSSALSIRRTLQLGLSPRFIFRYLAICYNKNEVAGKERCDGIMDSHSEEASLCPIHHCVYSALGDITAAAASFLWGRKKSQSERERGIRFMNLAKVK